MSRVLYLIVPIILIIIACEDPDTPKDDIILPEDAGNFKFVQYDSAYSGNEDFVVLYGDVISLSDSAQSITVTRKEIQKPDAWVTSFCVGPACLPPFLDTFTFTLAGGDTALFSLDTYPNGELGSGSWTIFAVDSTTMEIDSVSISMELVSGP